MLTFYQERIANEGYLPTATERRSLLELANLIGYRLKPGLSASTYLAFELEDGYELEIPAGTRAQSVPGPGELPQPFETAEPLYARAEWNQVAPRSTEPHIVGLSTNIIYVEGLQTNLKINAPIAIQAFDLNAQPISKTTEFRRVRAIKLDAENDRTILELSGELNLQTLKDLLNQLKAYTEPPLKKPIPVATPSVEVHPAFVDTQPPTPNTGLNNLIISWEKPTGYDDSRYVNYKVSSTQNVNLSILSNETAIQIPIYYGDRPGNKTTIDASTSIKTIDEISEGDSGTNIVSSLNQLSYQFPPNSAEGISTTPLFQGVNPDNPLISLTITPMEDDGSLTQPPAISIPSGIRNSFWPNDPRNIEGEYAANGPLQLSTRYAWQTANGGGQFTTSGEEVRTDVYALPFDKSKKISSDHYLQWTPLADAKSYSVQVVKADNELSLSQDFSQVVVAGTTHIQNFGESLTTYKWRVIAWTKDLETIVIQNPLIEWEPNSTTPPSQDSDFTLTIKDSNGNNKDTETFNLSTKSYTSNKVLKTRQTYNVSVTYPDPSGGSDPISAIVKINGESKNEFTIPAPNIPEGDLVIFYKSLNSIIWTSEGGTLLSSKRLETQTKYFALSGVIHIPERSFTLDLSELSPADGEYLPFTSGDSIEFSWLSQSPPNVTKLEIAEIKDFSSIFLAASPTGNSLSVPFTIFRPNQIYYWRIEIDHILQPIRTFIIGSSVGGLVFEDEVINRLNFAWPGPNRDYTFYIGTELDQNKVVVPLIDPKFVESSKGTEITRDEFDYLPGTHYVWQISIDLLVDDAGNTETIFSPVWGYQTKGELPADRWRKAVYKSAFITLLSRLAGTDLDTTEYLEKEPVEVLIIDELIEPMVEKLSDTTLPMDHLRIFLDIQQETALTILDLFNSLFNAEQTDYPNSRYDFREVLQLVREIQNGSQGLFEQAEASPISSVERLLKSKSIHGEEFAKLDSFLNPDSGESPWPQNEDQWIEKSDALIGPLLPPLTFINDNFIKPIDEGLIEDVRVATAESFIRMVDFYIEFLARLQNIDLKYNDGVDEPASKEKLDTLAEEFSELKSVYLLKIIQAVPVEESEIDESFLESLKRISVPPPSRLEQNADELFVRESSLATDLLTTFNPDLRGTYFDAFARIEVDNSLKDEYIDAFRVQATLYGATLPAKIPFFLIDPDSNGSTEPTTVEVREVTFEETIGAQLRKDPNKFIIWLDAEYKEILSESLIFLEYPRLIEVDNIKTISINEIERKSYRVSEAQTIAKENYGKITQLTLDQDWYAELIQGAPNRWEMYRKIVVYAQNEALPLTRRPIFEEVRGDTINLDALYEGLKPGRWCILSGERTDIPDISGGIRATELIRINSVKHRVPKTNDSDLIFDKPYTVLGLTKALTFRYKRDTVVIHANVVRATHGETKTEVLGSGDGSLARQTFTLKQKPLTFTAAATVTGVESSLETRVNDVRWAESDNLIFLGPNERGYVTKSDNEENVTLTFGDGTYGARLPSGFENIKAVYRQGIGKPGNVASERISLLATKPLGVKGVNNPLAATGGADRESLIQARRNAPLSVLALDRLVALKDFADFACNFAGIDKAHAITLFGPIDYNEETKKFEDRDFIQVTIAGADDIPIALESDLYNALKTALIKYNSLDYPIKLDVREMIQLFISINIMIDPDYLWDKVEADVRTALLNHFSFAARNLGQPAYRSEALAVVQSVPGVIYVDIDIFEGISETTPQSELESLSDTLTVEPDGSIDERLPQSLTVLRHSLPIIDVMTGRVKRTHIVERSNETLETIAARFKNVTGVDFYNT